MSLLNTSLDDTDTSMPMLAPGIYEFSVAKCTEETSSNGKPLLRIDLKLAQDSAPSTTGGTLNKGFPVFHRVSLTPTDKYDPLKALKLFKMAATGQGTGPFGEPASYENKIVKAKIKVSPQRTNEETGQTYEARNEVASFIA